MADENARSKRRRKDDDDVGGVPEWLVTFGDMMSLLLTFFIMLFAMSVIEVEKQQLIVEALHNRFGNAMSESNPIPGESPPANSQLAPHSATSRALRKDYMKGGAKVKAPVGEDPRVNAIRRANERIVGNAVHFKEGSARISDEGMATLRQIANQIKGKPQVVEIVGHTSAKPIKPNSGHRNHWDLSFNRAYNIMQILVNDMGVDPARIRLVEAAANEPAHLTPTESMQAKNSRVEIYLTDKVAEEVKGTPDEQASRYRTE